MCVSVRVRACVCVCVCVCIYIYKLKIVVKNRQTNVISCFGYEESIVLSYPLS